MASGGQVALCIFTPFPEKAGKWQVSVAGGRYPRWRADGKELFFLAKNDNILTAVAGSQRFCPARRHSEGIVRCAPCVFADESGVGRL